MLNFIRERAQGWVAWFIVGLITIPFALWGVNSYLTGASDVVVASVNGEPIKQTEFQRALQQYRDRMRETLGNDFDPSLFENAKTKQQILDGLIQQKLIYSANLALGQEVQSSDISLAIQQTEAFQVDGQFNLERYKMLLSRAGFSPASYESQLRADLMSRELTQSIRGTSLVVDFEINQLLRLEKQQRHFSYGVVEAAPLEAEIVVSDADANVYYEQHQALYTTPERLSVDYISLSIADLAAEVDVDDETLKQFYRDNESQFMTAEQRRASHILIEGDAEQALKILAAAEYRIQQGEAFEVVARELSQDAGSAAEGGDLGFFQRNDMDAAFDKAVFNLAEVGEVSQIVKTEFGHHLIKLTAIQPAEGKAFADAKQEIEASYRRQEAEQQFFEQAELLAELTYENPDSLDIAAEDLGLEIKSTTPFTRQGGEGIADNAKLVTMAFSDDVLKEDLNSPVIELSGNHFVVIHKKQHILTSQLDYDAVAEQIKTQLKSEQAHAKAREIGQHLVSQIESGEDARSLFSDGQWHQDVIADRSQASLDRALLNHIYTLIKPTDKPVYEGFSMTNGDYAVIQLNKVVEGDITQVSEQDRTGLDAFLARNAGETELEAFLASLKAQADIEISPHFLK